MGYIKTKGIVIREVNTGEADKVVTIFTRHYGKISGYAKGVRRTKSKLGAGTQYLCYSDLVLFKGRDMYTVSSSDVVEPFYEIRNDIVKLTYSAHIVDIIGDVVQENQPATKILQLLLNTLYVLTKTERSPELITRIFELRLLSLLGYAPYVRGCLSCGGDDIGSMLFSFKKCGFVCSSCKIHDNFAQEMSPATAKAIQYIIHAPLKDLFCFDLSPQILQELSRISKRYLRERLEKDYTKLDFLKGLEIT